MSPIIRGARQGGMPLQDFDGLAALTEKAKDVMGLSSLNQRFSNDILRVEISGPNRPHLTIVNLPGLIHSETKQQVSSDVDLIQDVVTSFMKKPRSIILAVVSVKNDFANQVVLKLARTADPNGTRTLGVITKPDTLFPGSESEVQYASLAQNQEVEFRLGWHDDTQRNKEEAAFMKQGIWKKLPESILEIDQLRSRLSQVLLGHITSELPALVSEIERKRTACKEKLEKLSPSRATLYEQQLHLLSASEAFQRITRDAVDGIWDDPFFQVDVESDHGYKSRLLAVVQNLNKDFAKVLKDHGHQRHIVTDVKKIDSNNTLGVVAITRDNFVEHVLLKMKRARGRELPGLFDPLIVTELFHEQAAPWGALAHSHASKALHACKGFLYSVVRHVTDTGTAAGILQRIVEPSMKKMLVHMKGKTDEVLKSHQRVHPITYKLDLSHILHSIRSKRNKETYTKTLKSFFDVSTLQRQSHSTFDMEALANTLMRDTTEPDLDQYAACEALDVMEAYYQVALKRFIDDIAVERGPKSRHQAPPREYPSTY
ncbi:hypothetical protein PG985_005602 [Apiospora marii]|uniref:uncharacterized protein n=1 Tax=Apiospora marii TaxID=335849 RepID=UPI00312ED067